MVPYERQFESYDSVGNAYYSLVFPHLSFSTRTSRVLIALLILDKQYLYCRVKSLPCWNIVANFSTCNVADMFVSVGLEMIQRAATYCVRYWISSSIERSGSWEAAAARLEPRATPLLPLIGCPLQMISLCKANRWHCYREAPRRAALGFAWARCLRYRFNGLVSVSVYQQMRRKQKTIQSTQPFSVYKR